jgi:hypothetical protein
MTTRANDYRIELAPDLFEPNECINLVRPAGADTRPDLACITISRLAAHPLRADLMWNCVRYAWDSFLSDFESLASWLCACVCGEDNRINRHRRLWRVVAAHGVQATTRTTEEVSVENADGTVCFYGATAVAGERAEYFRPVATPASRSFLALLPRAEVPAIDSLVTMGWRRGLVDPHELRNAALVVSKQKGVLLRLFGEFDDRETGVDCIMNSVAYERAVFSLRRFEAASGRLH